jgi:hypothetical protein
MTLQLRLTACPPWRCVDGHRRGPARPWRTGCQWNAGSGDRSVDTCTCGGCTRATAPITRWLSEERGGPVSAGSLRRIDDAPLGAYRYDVTDSFLVDWFNAVDLTYRTDLRELNELNFARLDAKLEQRLAELRGELLVELRTGIQQVRTEIQQVRADLHAEILQVRVELLRWMFGFWVTTLIGIAGLAIASR